MGAVYKSIYDCPAKNWFKYHETGDLLLFKKGADSEVSEKELIEGYKSIYNEYIEVFNLPASLKRIMTIKKLLIELRCDYLKTGKRFKLNKIQIKTADLERMEERKTKDPEKFHELEFAIEKVMQFKVDNVSVYDFYKYLRGISEFNEKQKLLYERLKNRKN